MEFLLGLNEIIYVKFLAHSKLLSVSPVAENMQDPVGPSKYNGLSVSPSPFLFAGKKFHLPRPSLSSKGADSSSC